MHMQGGRCGTEEPHVRAGRRVIRRKNLHEACTAGNHDIPDAFARLELRGACENRRLLPDVRFLKVAAMAIHGA